MPDYIILNDNPDKRTAKRLDDITAPTPQAGAAAYWNKHADFWNVKVTDADSRPEQDERDYARRKRAQWAEDRSRRTLWVGTGDASTFREI